MPSPVKIFISYAHEDETYKDELITHLVPLERENLIDSWNDRELVPGDDWDDEIKGALATAQIVLLLVSPDFIASDYIHKVEIAGAVDRHKKGEVVIAPVIVRTIDWNAFSLGRFQALPKGGKPISRWADKDEAWVSVTKGLRTLIRGINGEGREEREPLSPENTPSRQPDPAPPGDAGNDLEEASELIANARLEEALRLVRQVARAKAPHLENDLINLTGRYNRLERDERNGLLLPQQAQLQRNQITHALLSLLQELR